MAFFAKHWPEERDVQEIEAKEPEAEAEEEEKSELHAVEPHKLWTVNGASVCAWCRRTAKTKRGKKQLRQSACEGAGVRGRKAFQEATAQPQAKEKEAEVLPKVPGCPLERRHPPRPEARAGDDASVVSSQLVSEAGPVGVAVGLERSATQPAPPTSGSRWEATPRHWRPERGVYEEMVYKRSRHEAEEERRSQKRKRDDFEATQAFEAQLAHRGGVTEAKGPDKALLESLGWVPPELKRRKMVGKQAPPAIVQGSEAERVAAKLLGRNWREILHISHLPAASSRAIFCTQCARFASSTHIMRGLAGTCRGNEGKAWTKKQLATLAKGKLPSDRRGTAAECVHALH